ncbi:MAG: c-type cytochrome biogenesis protein CcsB, partial [Actinomycetota bacterium]|nr:c-type cytochrome biogenesis protein CcsB [Actinomycetota bacterium]
STTGGAGRDDLLSGGHHDGEAGSAPGVEAGGRGARAAGIAASLTTLAFGLHLAAVVTRGFATGRAPWANMYEFVLATTLAATGAYLVLLRRYDVRFLGVVTVPVVALGLGVALRSLYVPADDVVPALDSYWIAIHVTAAIVASGLFLAGGGLLLLMLAREREERRALRGRPGRGRVAAWVSRLPSPARLDQLAYRVHTFVFPLWTFAVVSGAIWADDAWGRYWGWDPKEVWAFITWVSYAAHLHARALLGPRSRVAAVIALVGFMTFLFNLFGVNIWFSGLHSYAF